MSSHENLAVVASFSFQDKAKRGFQGNASKLLLQVLELYELY